MPHDDFSTLILIQLFHSVSRCFYINNGYFVDTNLQQSKGLVLMNGLATMAEVIKEIAQQQVESSSGFVFSEDLG